jgi:glycosyltransferase involved in cell wall biosynthesis
MIVLPEIKIPLHDKTAIKAGEGVLPEYVDALRRTKTPWTTALHGSFYPEKDTPFIRQLLESPSRGTSLVTMSDESAKMSNDIFKEMSWLKGTLPYIPRFGIDDPLPSENIVGTSGRFIYNKGQPLIALAGAYLPEDVTVEIWGSCSVGLGPSPTFIVYEQLREHFGAQVKRYPTRINEAKGLDGNIITPYPWDARVEGHSLIRYLGNYIDAAAIASRFKVHMNLTGKNFAQGLVEYSTLEAADAGAMCVVPGHLSDPAFRMMVLDWYENSPTQGRLVSDDGIAIIKKVAEAFETCLQIPENDRIEIARHNRETLRVTNCPKKTAQVMIESAFS